MMGAAGVRGEESQGRKDGESSWRSGWRRRATFSFNRGPEPPERRQWTDGQKRILEELNSYHGKERSHHTPSCSHARTHTHKHTSPVTRSHFTLTWGGTFQICSSFPPKFVLKFVSGSCKHALSFITVAHTGPRQWVHSVSLRLTHTHTLPRNLTHISHLLMTVTNAYWLHWMTYILFCSCLLSREHVRAHFFTHTRQKCWLLSYDSVFYVIKTNPMDTGGMSGELVQRCVFSSLSHTLAHTHSHTQTR